MLLASFRSVEVPALNSYVPVFRAIIS